MLSSPDAEQWFKDNVQICYRWYADGDGGQCGGGAAQLLCASVGSSIETTQIIEAVVVECHGYCPFLLMHLSGSVTSSFAISGIQMVMVVSVVLEKVESFVLIPTSGRSTTETIRIIGEEAVRWHGSYVLI